jgi:O-antigen/teichoic acid export membrane protein
MLSASNAIVITFLGHPALVPIYSCTAKLSVMTAQLAWVPPDSALVGLAQLHGERQGPERLRHVVFMMLRLHLLLSGAAMCGLLAFNPTFVTRWVGEEFFGGLSLNLMLALGVVVYSLVHGVITTASVVGNRLQIGTVTLVNGVVQTALALGFAGPWGLTGIAMAGLVAGIVTSIPVGVRLLGRTTQLTSSALARELIGPWFVRVAAIAAVSGVVGAFHQVLGLVFSGLLAAAIVLIYVWYMRPFYVGLPLDPRWVDWLVRIRLMPAQERSEATHPA